LNKCKESKKLKNSETPFYLPVIQGCWYVLSPTRKETSYSDRIFWYSYILFIII